MRKPKTGNEQKTVKPKIRKLLDKHGWFWWATPATMYSQSGISDILAVKAGMFLAVEAKFGRNDPTPMQVAYLNSVRAEQHFAFVVRETTIDAFEMFLDMLDRSMEYAAQQQVPPADVGGPMLDAIQRMGDTEILNAAEFERQSKAYETKRAKNDTETGQHRSRPAGARFLRHGAGADPGGNPQG